MDLNILGFRGNMSVPWDDNFGVARLDHDFGPKWHFYTSYRYYKMERATGNQVDIGGFYSGGHARNSRIRVQSSASAVVSDGGRDHQYNQLSDQRLPLQLLRNYLGPWFRCSTSSSCRTWPVRSNL